LLQEELGGGGGQADLVLEIVVFQNHIRLMVAQHLHRTSAGISGRGGRGGSTDLEPSKSSSSAAEEEGSEVSFLREEDLDLCFLTRVKMYFWLQCVQVTFWPICGGVEFLLTQDPFRSYFSLMTSSSGLRKMLFVTKK
jgi:hypothetical protein